MATRELHLIMSAMPCLSPSYIYISFHSCSVVFDIGTHVRLRVLPRPVYSVAPDGTLAASLCFLRLHVTEPGVLSFLTAQSTLR